MSKYPKAAFTPNTQKNPAVAKDPTCKKIARAIHGDNANQLNPAWRVSAVEMIDPYGWHTLSGPKLREVHQKLAEFENRSWNEILVVSKRQNHAVATSALCKIARDRLAELQLDDVEELISLRLAGAERVWGIRTHNVLTLIWWDPDHQVCPSLKRNT